MPVPDADSFTNSNLVAFYYGNLTHPSLDPPRIGFLSMVPDNADSIVQSDDSRAQSNGGLFGSTPIPNSMTCDTTHLSHRHFSSCSDECGEQCLDSNQRRPSSFDYSYVFITNLDICQIECIADIWALNQCGTRSLHDPPSHVL
jgi:hypothetical protein